jgi:hypothetical protein
MVIQVNRLLMTVHCPSSARKYHVHKRPPILHLEFSPPINEVCLDN